MMNRIVKLLLTCTFSFLTLFPVAAQKPADSVQTLEERFTDLLRKSETYQEYKVVRRSTLNMFWAALSDSISTGNAALKEALVGKMEAEQKLRQSQDSLRQAQAIIRNHSNDSAQVSF